MTSKSTKRSILPLLAIAIGLAFGPKALLASEEVETLKRQNAALQQRLESVERDLAAIKQLLAPPTTAAAVVPAPPPAAAVARSAPTSSFTEAETAKLKSLAGMKGQPARSSLDLNFYGYVKLDVAYEDSRSSIGNFARWMESESVLPDDSHFNLTANQTRFGVDASGPTSASFQASGKMEIDFYGGGVAENKPEPMLRHAYLRLDWPTRKLALIAGQTWDIISPLNPTTVNYSVAWWQGNAGYRRPQLRLVKSVDIDDGVELKLDGGISRTITGRKTVFASVNDPDTGADAGYPTVAGRAGMSFPTASKQVATFGVSGHAGTEEIHRSDLQGSDTYETWSVNADLRLPLGPTVLLQAEAFKGRNFDSYLGGIGQGINPALKREVDTVGGWVSVTLTPSTRWQFNLGAGVDDPDDDDLSGSVDSTKDARTKNTLVFGNVHYSLITQVQLAFELSWLQTTYKLIEPGSGWRQQIGVTYKF